jgi:glutathione synthase/RimK-type ligase-like ATP-grasp enzyme
MNGLLVYSKEDLKKNSDYITWFLNEAQKRNIAIRVTTDQQIETLGINKNEVIDFVINRSRSYEISLLFELNDIKVFNNSSITLIGNNKLAAYAYAKEKGYDFPRILLDFSSEKEILVKPNNGHGGEGIHLVNDIKSFSSTEKLKQEYISDIIGDIRFYIINNQIINAVIRSSEDKIVSNFSQGGAFQIYNYSKNEELFIKKFMVGKTFDYVGLDFFLTKEGELLFNEVEDVVGSRMLSALGVNNTTELYLEHIYHTVYKKNTK